jgi:hypothetical protein
MKRRLLNFAQTILFALCVSFNETDRNDPRVRASLGAHTANR